MTPEKISETSKGVYIIAATPFTDDGELDLESTDSLTDFYLAQGVTGFTILGMMGEAPKLTETETLSVMTRVLDRVAGRAPVVVGVSHAATSSACRRPRWTGARPASCWRRWPT